jgi:hypothetical protein
VGLGGFEPRGAGFLEFAQGFGGGLAEGGATDEIGDIGDVALVFAGVEDVNVVVFFPS